jgi:hypothetical protein
MADHQSPAPAGNPNETEQPSTSLQPYLDRVDSMDPYRDVPSNVVDKSPDRRVSPPTLETLAPEQRGPIVEKLYGLHGKAREETETRLVRQAMRQSVKDNRFLTGLGEDALPFHKEQVTIARRVYDIDRAIDREAELLAEITRFETVIDPQTAEPTPSPVYRVTGARRHGVQTRIQELQHERAQFVQEDGSMGIQAQRDLAKAREESARMLQKIDQQRWEAVEVERRAAQINSERRINQQAEARARMTRDVV